MYNTVLYGSSLEYCTITVYKSMMIFEGTIIIPKSLYIIIYKTIRSIHMQGYIQDFCQGGANLSMSKRGGERLFVAAEG